MRLAVLPLNVRMLCTSGYGDCWPKWTSALRRQAEVLNDGGWLLHSFWYGEEEQEFSGLRFVQYTKASFAEVLGAEFEIVEAKRYTEMEADDSIYFLLRKR